MQSYLQTIILWWLYKGFHFSFFFGGGGCKCLPCEFWWRIHLADIIMVACFLLLLFFVQTIAEKRILLNDPDLIQTQIHALERKVEDVVAKNTDLSTKYTDLTTKYNDLFAKYNTLLTKTNGLYMWLHKQAIFILIFILNDNIFLYLYVYDLFVEMIDVSYFQTNVQFNSVINV